MAYHFVQHMDLQAKLRRNMPEPLPVILLGKNLRSTININRRAWEHLLYGAVRIVKAAAETIALLRSSSIQFQKMQRLFT